jgi:hypothetical protein
LSCGKEAVSDMASREGGREARPFFGNVASSSIAVRFLDALRAAIQSVRGLRSPTDQWQASHAKHDAAVADGQSGTAIATRQRDTATHPVRSGTEPSRWVAPTEDDQE